MTRQRGVTLVEVLVAVGLVALLIALLVPAVHSAREAARKTQCQNHLRQVLLATQSFHSAENGLPSLYNGTSLKYPLNEWDLFHMHSWRVELLPYLGQSALRDKIRWDELATADANLPVAQTPVPVFLCPSGDAPEAVGRGLKHGAVGLPPERVQERHRYSVVRSDYDAMAGIQVRPRPPTSGGEPGAPDYVRWGIWGWPVFDTPAIGGSRLLRYRRGRFDDVTDGLSHTLAVVERGGKPIQYRNGRPEVTPDNPDAEYPGQVGWSASNTFMWAINALGNGVNVSNTRGVYSFHPGGANAGLADGSVRFLSDATDFDTLVALFGRSDGRPVPP